MKLLLVILVGITLGVGAMALTASNYQTPDVSNIRLYQRVFGK